MICSSCGLECNAVQVDFGIGPYEFQGQRRNHHDWQAVSPCCESPLVEGGNLKLKTAICRARKQYGNIAIGELHKATVVLCWRKHGPRWYRTIRRKIA